MEMERIWPELNGSKSVMPNPSPLPYFPLIWLVIGLFWSVGLRFVCLVMVAMFFLAFGPGKAMAVSGDGAVKCDNVVFSGTMLGCEFVGPGGHVAVVAADLVASDLRRECNGSQR
ncbi:hypothetical protein Dimus_007935 [Dionaea muscipula]